MAKKLQLQIPEPCHENWNAMSPSEKGRFCGSCQKQVVDFTGMSDREVLAYFQTASSSVCGRFQEDQLHRDISLPKKSIPWGRYFFKFTLPLFLASLKAGAQKSKEAGVNDTVTVVAPSMKACTVTMGMVTRPSTVQKDNTINVSGTVKGIDGNVIAHASIILKGTNKGFVTDSNGHFNFNKEQSAFQIITISALGFNEKEILIKPETSNLDIILEENTSQLFGEVVVVTGYVIRKPTIVKTIPERIKDTIFTQFKVFPNPAQSAGSLHVQWKGSRSGDFLLVIRDLAGKEMLRREMAVEKKSIQTIQLPVLLPGSFFAVLTDKKSGKTFTEKFVVQ